MTTPPTPPSTGKPISASFFARLIDWVKSGMLIEGTGYRLRRGPNGTALVIEKSPRPAPVVLPWTFVCKKSEGEDGKEKREGGWVNCKVQIGYKLIEVEEGVDQTDDGDYYCVCDLFKDTAKVYLSSEVENTILGYDIKSNTMAFFVGTVDDGKQIKGPHMYPVAYKVL